MLQPDASRRPGFRMFSRSTRVATLAILLFPAAAFAQLPGQDAPLPPPPGVPLPYSPAASGPPYCPKLCRGDMTPCDPIYMKEADGRCDGISADLDY